MSRNSEIRTFIIILRAKSFSYSFYWICKFLWIRILKAKMLRIRILKAKMLRIRILIAKMLRIGSWKPKRLESNGNGSQALQLWIFNKSSNLDQLFYVTKEQVYNFLFGWPAAGKKQTHKTSIQTYILTIQTLCFYLLYKYNKAPALCSFMAVFFRDLMRTPGWHWLLIFFNFMGYAGLLN